MKDSAGLAVISGRFFAIGGFFFLFVLLNALTNVWTIITSTSELGHCAGLTRRGRIPAETLGGSGGNFSKMMPSGLFLLADLLQGIETQRPKLYCLKYKTMSALQSRE